MKSNKRNYWLIGIVACALLLLLIVLVTSLDALNVWLARGLRIFRPVIIGLVVAYLLNPFFRLFETKLFKKISPPRLRRVISLICSYILLFSVFVILILLIVPQLVQSIMDFIDDSDVYLSNTVSSINDVIRFINSKITPDNLSSPIPFLDSELIKTAFFDFIQSLNLKEKLMQLVTIDSILALFAILKDIVTVVLDIVFGLFISLYLLNTKEKRYAQIMRYRRAFFSDSINRKITHFCTVADRSFGGFLEGKIIDSGIIGVLVYIAISIFDVPYAILIATVVAITDIVPIIGPFIGVIPSAIIVLLSDPSKVIPFLLCILVIQQIDGNIIAPKILGENTGVSSLCVIIAITTMGSLWGLAGMVLGVPLFATVLELTNGFLNKRLKKKGIPISNEEEPEEKEGLFARFKNKSLYLQKNYTEGGNGDLSRREKFQLDTYSLAVKYHIFSESSDEALSRFLTEKNALLSVLDKETDSHITGISNEIPKENENTPMQKENTNE